MNLNPTNPQDRENLLALDTTGNTRPWAPTADELAQFRQMFGPAEDSANWIETEIHQGNVEGLYSRGGNPL